jgi:hypothetical protein
VAAQSEFGFEQPLGRRRTQVLKASDLILGKVVIGDIGQGRTAPQPECFAQCRCGIAGRAGGE